MFYRSYQQIRVHSNINVSSPDFTDENDQPIIGREFDFTGRYYAGYLFNFVDREGVIDTVQNIQTYTVTAEVRQDFPNLILTEDVRISREIIREDEFVLNLEAEITFNPDIVYEYAPMWLWFPNDDPDAHVELSGWYNDGFGLPIYTVDTLEVMASPDSDPPGFFIHLPTVRDPTYENQYWWVIVDPTLHVSCSDTMSQFINTARFIMPTAPLRPSRVTITAYCGYEQYRFSSPFDSCSIEEVPGGMYYARFNFFGYCREPGIVQAWWNQPNGVPATEVIEIPTEPRLYTAYPNPFNSTTTIGYSLLVAGNVSLAVYDLSGREMARLADGVKVAGTHEAVWVADGVSSGVYVVKLDAGGVVMRETVVLVG